MLLLFALQQVTAHVKDTVIVTDLYPRIRGQLLSLVELLTASRLIRFLPNAKRQKPVDAWWAVSPRLIAEYLQILGFSRLETTFHKQIYHGKETKLYTIVGQREKF
ncbi:hypothetical protein [Candidatus Viridilinea mediisalina]|uniref:hypothetical protein n=1 Tax=Candidatus Viridilinea mediisalina TaxID=2024553 RepID=UPI000F59E780|nr:hypothetical protein [Candidatus Viridilinea mediisalina]